MYKTTHFRVLCILCQLYLPAIELQRSRVYKFKFGHFRAVCVVRTAYWTSLVIPEVALRGNCWCAMENQCGIGRKGAFLAQCLIHLVIVVAGVNAVL